MSFHLQLQLAEFRVGDHRVGDLRRLAVPRLLDPQFPVLRAAQADAALAEHWAKVHPELPEAGITREELARQSEAHAEPARELAYRLFDAWIENAL